MPRRGGIIPARAGFTRPSSRGRSPCRDHPRSRGVYPFNLPVKSLIEGSSPLARGLRDVWRCGRPGSRIIPARAGFTDTDSHSGDGPPDHPRSRGVYLPSLVATASIGGSSPLARGLRSPQHPVRQVRRIIPARAGFTRRLVPGCRRRWDHPRSRGVYRAGAAAGAAGPGSSPLARGLPTLTVLEPNGIGIIPARAGFTRPACGSAFETEDHPRSRGVYGSPSGDCRLHQGSSPLARGLLVGELVRVLPVRIIPARAGFTPEQAPPRSWSPDHPRSRGVYAFVADTVLVVCGSSPLARGLPAYSISMRNSSGIIPARAGFTMYTASNAHQIADHPRSRGVYFASITSLIWFGGSSPLARGLRIVEEHSGILVGIIPARAGFTSRRNRSQRGTSDHPRSRGVYSAEPCVLGAERIIPARAGFTGSACPIPWICADHPRSRGVYRN